MKIKDIRIGCTYKGVCASMHKNVTVQLLRYVGGIQAEYHVRCSGCTHKADGDVCIMFNDEITEPVPTVNTLGNFPKKRGGKHVNK